MAEDLKLDPIIQKINILTITLFNASFCMK